MKVGDLVKFRCPTTPQVGNVYLVIWKEGAWLGLSGKGRPGKDLHAIGSFEVVSESR